MKKIFRLGTRGSPLALVQAQIVREELLRLHVESRDTVEIEIVPLRTLGDWRPEQKEQSFLELGGNKGLFTKEIEEELLAGTLDFAVHSMKDVSVWETPGLTYGAMLRRADPHDAFLSALVPKLDDLPAGARVGTSSLRRKAQILSRRPDLQVVPLRGNVDTRLRKLATEEADATILAVAGLTRLGVLDRAASILDYDAMLPAVAQGILGLQLRADDKETRDWIRPLNHVGTETCMIAERAMLRRMDGSCKTPIAGLAEFDRDGRLVLEGLAAIPDGSHLVRRKITGKPEDAAKLGETLGGEIVNMLPGGFFEG